MTRWFVLGLSMLVVPTVYAAERTLYDFDESGAAKAWRAVNDGVMGGRSRGEFAVGDDGTLAFTGVLSLENNGGFASVRSRGQSLGLRAGDVIVARVRGDGREYSVNLYTPARRIAFAHRAKFQTEKDEWTEVRVPLSDFQATWFGRRVRDPLDPAKVSGLGIVLGDKKAGPFKLEVDWIKVDSGDAES